MLYIVATPIGNLEDITLRALRILKEVNFVLAEDTRVANKLLSYYKIDTKTISFHEHSDDSVYKNIEKLLKEGKDLALVTDAGTPGISDPGGKLVEYVRENLPDLKINSVPGPSSLSAAISISGIPLSHFYFAGFAPTKKGRETFFSMIAERTENEPVIFFESSHRILKTLEALNKTCPRKEILVFKELTKMFEEVIKGNPEEVLSVFEGDLEKVKGEFVVIVRI